MHRIKPPSRKKVISTFDDLIQAVKKYENIKYIELAVKYESEEPWYRRDKDTSEFYYCPYCMKLKNYNDDNMPFLELISSIKYGNKIYCKCVLCGMILCYRCFTKVQIEKNKYLKTGCMTCINRKIQAEKPTKKCECSPDCKAIIAITNLRGQPQKYASGHGLKAYHSTHNFKWTENNEEVEEYERQQHNS